MLAISEKISFLNNYLKIKNDNYGDVMKEELCFYFFEKNDANDFVFLENLNSQNAIEDKIELLVSKMIIHEHEDGLSTIIENHL